MLTFAVYVQDHPGVLNRVASLFRRRAFNIESLTVGHTERAGVSRMTIVVDAPESSRTRIEANLYKLIDVERIESIPIGTAVYRDLALIKVAASQATRSEVMQLVHVFRARVVDVAHRIARGRNYRNRRQDRRPDRRAATVRRARNGADWTSRDDARHREFRHTRRKRACRDGRHDAGRRFLLGVRARSNRFVASVASALRRKLRRSVLP